MMVKRSNVNAGYIMMTTVIGEPYDSFGPFAKNQYQGLKDWDEPQGYLLTALLPLSPDAYDSNNGEFLPSSQT